MSGQTNTALQTSAQLGEHSQQTPNSQAPQANKVVPFTTQALGTQKNVKVMTPEELKEAWLKASPFDRWDYLENR